MHIKSVFREKPGRLLYLTCKRYAAIHGSDQWITIQKLKRLQKDQWKIKDKWKAIQKGKNITGKPFPNSKYMARING